MITIIAEIGINHCGDMALAKRLIELAQVNGADLIKSQLYDTDKLHKPDFKWYQECKQAELTFKQAKELFQYGKRLGIEVFFSVADVERVEWCEKIGVKRYKIAYGKRLDEELIEAVALTGKPVIISTDLDFFWKWDLERVTLLYCISHYPTELNELKFGEHTVWEGFSDHTIGLDAAEIALARGTRIIEKHFAISHNTGVDAPWSMTPDELRRLRRFADAVEEAL